MLTDFQVSRCGMIYMEPATLGWLPFVQSWIPTLNSDWCEGKEESVMDLFQWLVPPCLYFINKNCTQFCKPGDINLVNNMMNMVEMLMNEALTGGTKKEDQEKYLDIWMQASFIQAGMLSS